jgi:hypothetical protein
MPPVISPRTGEVFLRNYDQGVVETMAGYVATLGGNRNYYIDIPACNPAQVPVIFLNPEQVYEDKIYPSFVMARTGAFPALQRWHSVGQMEYVFGDSVSGVSTITLPDGSSVSGFDQLEMKAQAMPFDLTYDLTCYARYEREAVPMLKHLLRVWQPYSKIKLIDSLGQNRIYNVYNEGDVADLSEIVDVADRVKAYMISIRIEGELDLSDPYVRSTVLQTQQNLGVL